MTALLGAIAELGPPYLWGFGLVFLRIGSAMALLPAFGERSIPVRIRLAIAVAFTLIVSPAVVEPSGASGPPDLGIAGIEILAGLAIGIVLRLAIIVLQIAGTIAANATSLSQILGAATVDPQPAMGHVLVIAGLALAVMSGLHVALAELLILSYTLFPVGAPIRGDALAQWGTHHVAAAFSLAFSLAAPFVLLSLVYNLALGAMNRAMPQLMVAFVGAPLITFGGLALLAVAGPFILGLWFETFTATLRTLEPQ